MNTKILALLLLLLATSPVMASGQSVQQARQTRPDPNPVNYVIDADGNKIDLTPYLNHEPNAPKRIRLAEPNNSSSDEQSRNTGDTDSNEANSNGAVSK